MKNINYRYLLAIFARTSYAKTAFHICAYNILLHISCMRFNITMAA